LLLLLKSKEQVVPHCSFCKEQKSELLCIALCAKSERATCFFALFVKVQRQIALQLLVLQKAKERITSHCYFLKGQRTNCFFVSKKEQEQKSGCLTLLQLRNRPSHFVVHQLTQIRLNLELTNVKQKSANPLCTLEFINYSTNWQLTP